MGNHKENLPLRTQTDQLFIPFEDMETEYNLNDKNEKWDQSKNILHVLTIEEVLDNLFELITDREYLENKKEALKEMFGSDRDVGEIRNYAIYHRGTSDALTWALNLEKRSIQELEQLRSQKEEKKKLFYNYLSQLHHMTSNEKNKHHEMNFREGEDWEVVVEKLRKYYREYCNPYHRIKSNKKI